MHSLPQQNAHCPCLCMKSDSHGRPGRSGPPADISSIRMVRVHFLGLQLAGAPWVWPLHCRALHKARHCAPCPQKFPGSSHLSVFPERSVLSPLATFMTTPNRRLHYSCQRRYKTAPMYISFLRCSVFLLPYFMQLLPSLASRLMKLKLLV